MLLSTVPLYIRLLSEPGFPVTYLDHNLQFLNSSYAHGLAAVNCLYAVFFVSGELSQMIINLLFLFEKHNFLAAVEK